MMKQLRLFPVFLSEDKPYVLERLERVVGRRVNRMVVMDGWQSELATIAVIKEKKALQPYLSVVIRRDGYAYYTKFYQRHHAMRSARNSFMWYLSGGV